jgi:beta-1,4-N-acetylglucosaminyltransferase
LIFVTVGMHYQGFERLIRKMDEIAPVLNEEVVMQIGSTKYAPKNSQAFEFLDNAKMYEYYNKSSLIISHGGAGTILEALAAQKPLIVVPRLKRYGEVIDDQQDELASALSEKGLAAIVYDVEKLTSTISQMRKNEFLGYKSSKDLIHFLERSFTEGEN